MKNVFIIHSYNGDTEYSFAPSIEKLCNENNIDYYFPKFPIRSEATYESWENILNNYKNKNLLNEESIIIGHSLGTQFIPKYIARNNIKINTYISVAGFINYKGREDLEKTIKIFQPTNEEFNKCKILIDKIYSIYSDNDEMNSINNLEDYADKLSAHKILIKGAGHFNPKSNITKINEINKIILGEWSLMLDNFESISPTAILTSYPRIFTDIPYEKEIYNWLKNNCNENVKLNKMLAPEIEARYKLTNKILDKLNIKQVLELASGYSSRGLIYSKNGYKYVEMDLEEVCNNKIKLLNSIDKIPETLHIVSGNALNENDFENCKRYFDNNKELAIINEGLLRYLTFDEKKVVARNIYNMLKKYNGVWITCDVTPKKFIEKQDKCLPNFNINLNTITSRNDLKDRFNDIEHINSFFGEIGFKNIEVHKFIEMKNELKSFDILGIDKNQYSELLENGIVAILKI